MAQTDLATLGQRFLDALNTRDWSAAEALYATDASYASPGLVENVAGRGIEGRDQIMAFFKDALAGDDEFQLALVDQFVGVDMVVVVSSLQGRAFVDVLRTDSAGLIVDHSEVAPKPSLLAST